MQAVSTRVRRVIGSMVAGALLGSAHAAAAQVTVMTDTVFPRLGLAGAVNVIATPRGTGAAAMVASGAAPIAVMPVSEIVHAPGVELAGVIAEEIQLHQVFAAAIVASSNAIEPSRRLIAFLSSERASGTIKDSGMEPLAAVRRDR